MNRKEWALVVIGTGLLIYSWGFVGMATAGALITLAGLAELAWGRSRR